MNTQTALVSPQLHVVYDDNFDTCKHDANFASLWQQKAKFVEHADDYNKEILPTNISQQPPDPFPVPRELLPIPPSLQQVPFIEPPQASTPKGEEITTPPQPTEQNQQATQPHHSATQPQETPAQPLPSLAPLLITQPEGGTQQQNTFSINIAPSCQTRSGRTVRPPARYSFSALLSTESYSFVNLHCETLASDNSGHFNNVNPLAALISFAATKKNKTSDPDKMTLEQALSQPDAEKFIEAMEKELLDHTANNPWEMVPIHSVPRRSRSIPIVCSFLVHRSTGPDSWINLGMANAVN